MANPLWLTRNLFNPFAFPTHTVTADQEDTAHPIARVHNGRLSAGDYWTPTSTNTTRFLRVDAGAVPMAFDTVVVVHNNLGGGTVTGYVSNDGGLQRNSVFSLTVPSIATYGNLADGDGISIINGNRNIWLYKFTLQTATLFDFEMAGLGAGTLQQVVQIGLYLGYEPRIPDLPISDQGRQLLTTDTSSEDGWVGRSRATSRRSGTFAHRLDDEAEVPVVEDQILHPRAGYASGRLSWLIYDQDASQNAMPIVVPGQSDLRYEYTDDWFVAGGLQRTRGIPWQEAAPVRL